MEENVVWEESKNSLRPFRDFLKAFSLTSPIVDSFKNRLSRAIEQLPYEEKIVLSLYYCEEMTAAEIAIILQKNEQDISQLYLNAISNLRSKIHPNV